MKVISILHDGRINARNVLFEATAGEYLAIAKGILKNNEFQRRRVKASPTLYSLLKEDILLGCVIPPIVLALGGEGATEMKPGHEEDFVLKNSSDLLILDGLQRTTSMIELEDELLDRDDKASLKKLYDHLLRVEIYVGLDRLGILYRMLTLNTGQTPMSLRQQVEILFLDYARLPIGGITLVREADTDATDALGKYSFKAVIDGFNSFLERNELPIDKYDVLESVKSLERLSKESTNEDLFKEFTESYHSFVVKMNELTNSKTYGSEELEIKGQPFGIDARRIFSKEQSLAGFGAAAAKLRDYGKIQSFDDLKKSIASLDSPLTDSLIPLLKRLEEIRLNSKKIGNSQRLYFHFFFRELFNPDSDAYRRPDLAADAAYQKYQSQML